MNQYLKHENLPALSLVCGGIGMLLRSWLLSTENSKGFIQQGHISEWLLLILTGAYLVVLFLSTRSLQQGSKFRFNFPASPIAAGGTALAALGAAIMGVTDLFTAGSAIDTASAIAGILAAAALALAAWCRYEGKRPSMLLHTAVCLWLMLRLICVYRSWSADPQLEDYAFQLLAIVCCMLASYHRAAFDTDEGHRGPYVFFALSGVYFCCLSLAGPDSILLYLSLGIWMFTDLCNLTPMPREFWSEES